MKQHVNRADTRSYPKWSRAGLIRAVYTNTDTDDTLLHHHRYTLLHTWLNDSPAVITEGDYRVSPLVRVFCGRCGTPIGHVSAEDARARRGALVLVLWTQRWRGEGTPDYELVPVALYAPAEPELGRPPMPVPPVVETHCRAHGPRRVKTAAALRAAQRELARFDRDGKTHGARIDAW